MDSRHIELALRKQKLQLRAEAQRTDIAQRLAGIDGALDRVDSLRDNLAWAKDKIPVLSVALLVVLAAKPKLTLRLAKRAWVGWLLLRHCRRRYKCERARHRQGPDHYRHPLPLPRAVASHRSGSPILGRRSQATLHGTNATVSADARLPGRIPA